VQLSQGNNFGIVCKKIGVSDSPITVDAKNTEGCWLTKPVSLLIIGYEVETLSSIEYLVNSK